MSDVDASPEAVAAMVERLTYAQVASCECFTKTPEVSHHRANCRYRVLDEAAALLSQVATRAEKAERERDEARALIAFDEQVAQVYTALIKQIDPIDEVDGSANWWMFADEARKYVVKSFAKASRATKEAEARADTAFRQIAEARAEIDRLKEVEHAARFMPRKTLKGGNASDRQDYPIMSAEVWQLDRALTNLDEVRALLSGDQIKYMVNRFLGWKLPKDFSPDAGISFKATFNEGTPRPMKHQPSGTNLFDATQAEAMVRYMIEGMPGP